MLKRQHAIDDDINAPILGNPLTQAILARNFDMIKLLLTEYAFSLNRIQKDGYRTPLMYAVRTGHFDIVKLMFDEAHTV